MPSCRNDSNIPAQHPLLEKKMKLSISVALAVVANLVSTIQNVNFECGKHRYGKCCLPEFQSGPLHYTDIDRCE
jgi:hypothetical protein